MTIEKTSAKAIDKILSGDHDFVEVVDPIQFIQDHIGGELPTSVDSIVQYLGEMIGDWQPMTREALLNLSMTNRFGDDWQLYVSEKPMRMIYQNTSHWRVHID